MPARRVRRVKRAIAVDDGAEGGERLLELGIAPSHPLATASAKHAHPALSLAARDLPIAHVKVGLGELYVGKSAAHLEKWHAKRPESLCRRVLPLRRRDVELWRDARSGEGSEDMRRQQRREVDLQIADAP